MAHNIPMTIIVGSMILVLLANFLIYVLFTFQKRYYQHKQEISSIREKYERELLTAQLEIKEQTMKNISQEIHDNIGQVLSLANLQLTAIELENAPFATMKIERSMELISRVITDLRDLSKTLNPENIGRIGLTDAIRFDLGLMERSKVFSTYFDVEGKEQRLEPHTEIILYRIVQQALNNTLRHAKATSASIFIQYLPDRLMITITDNGIGFNTSIIRSETSEGAGLRNMIHRAGLVQAEIGFQSNLQEGTIITLSVPYSLPKKYSE